MRSHLQRQQPDPAISTALDAIWPAVGLLSLMLGDNAKDLSDPARRTAIRAHAQGLIGAAKVLQDLGVRTAR